MSTVDLPNIREPWTDPRTGQISRAWWLWLQQLMTRIGGSSATDLTTIIAAVNALIAADIAQANEINGFVALPPDLDEKADEAAFIGAPPGKYAFTDDTLAQFSATTSAQLRALLTDETGTGAAVFGTSPTLNQANLVGTTTNDNADAGSVGEYVTNTTTLTAAASGTPLNAASISLTAGDWDVTGLIKTNPAGATTTSVVQAGISTTSATFANITGGFEDATILTYAAPAGFQVNVSAPTTRISLAATTTVYLVGQANFAVSTMTISGFIRARRVR